MCIHIHVIFETTSDKNVYAYVYTHMYMHIHIYMSFHIYVYKIDKCPVFVHPTLSFRVVHFIKNGKWYVHLGE